MYTYYMALLPWTSSLNFMPPLMYMLDGVLDRDGSSGGKVAGCSGDGEDDDRRPPPLFNTKQS